MQKGKVQVNTENIFPIIKKFLYTDHEIFLRELISNAVDATRKLKVLVSRGDASADLSDLKISVVLDEAKKTITVSDNGIGMTAGEIDKYINQIAFSGAEEFVEKFKDDKENANIIGHFGLGFYSAFMVADKVEIQTLSYAENAEPARWQCEGTTDFKITKGNRRKRGTNIILYINEDSAEFLSSYRISTMLNKYCRFLPIEIEFDGKVINETKPLWTKAPAELKDEDYLNFYKSLYPMAGDPMFWIHLNVDYPFNLTGILYFPKITNEVDPNRNKIQLYSNQVYVTDNVKDIVPDYLMLLHGIIDSPDIPLNVSRSSLQADGHVKKITGHISKKVSDKLAEIFKNDRENFEQKWNDVSIFVKYGMISDEKFHERAMKFCLLQDVEDKTALVEDYIKSIEAGQKDKDGQTVVLYTSDPKQQHMYVNSAQRKGYSVLKLGDVIDNHFMQHLETRLEKVTFKRVDSEQTDKLIDKNEAMESVLNEEDSGKLKSGFESYLADKHFDVELASLNPDESFTSIIKPEWERRFKEMKQFGGMDMFGQEKIKLIVNSNHKAARSIIDAPDEDARNERIQFAVDLAKLASNSLSGQELSRFIEKSYTHFDK